VPLPSRANLELGSALRRLAVNAAITHPPFVTTV